MPIIEPMNNWNIVWDMREENVPRPVPVVEKPLPMPKAPEKPVAVDQNPIIRDCFFLRQTNGDVGIEIELEAHNRFPRDIPRKFGWEFHNEGSLRGNAAEYVTKGAVFLKDVQERIQSLDQLLKDFGTKLNNSYRTSTHIHLNVQECTVSDVCGILTISAVIEPLLLRLCGQTRDGNLFCVPCYETGDMPFFVRELIRFGKERRNIPVRDKYSTVNTGCLRTFGTVEYRCFPSTVDSNTIHDWTKLLHRIRYLAMNERDRTFIEFVNHAYADPAWLVDKLQMNPLGHNIEQLVRFGCKTGYEIARVIQDQEAG